MVLYLNTTHFNKAVVGVMKKDKFVDKKEITAGKNLSQNLLAEIDLLLKRNHLKIEGITAIKVATQSVDTFTGTRMGIAVANALGFGLGVTVNGQKIAIPEYEKEANIGI